MNRIAAFVISLLSTGLAGQAWADTQAHEEIYAVARSFMQQELAREQLKDATLEIGTLDKRLRLARCEQPLAAYLPRGSRHIGKTTIGVRCMGLKPWSINLTARVDVFRRVLVSVGTLSRGDEVTSGDIMSARRNLASLPHGYLEDTDDTVGMVAKRRILPGTALTPSMLKKPQLVKRGQQVTIVADAGNASVSMMGKALSAGAMGEMIQVQNKSSNRKLQGVVSGPGEVRVR